MKNRENLSNCSSSWVKANSTVTNWRKLSTDWQATWWETNSNSCGFRTMRRIFIFPNGWEYQQSEATNVSNPWDGEQWSQEWQAIWDKQLNTAWFVFGTKVGTAYIGRSGSVLGSSFHRAISPLISTWTKSIYSSRLNSYHPSVNGCLPVMLNKRYVLHITNHTSDFLGTSKYLVVLVK